MSNEATLADIWQDYLENHCQTDVKPRSKQFYEQLADFIMELACPQSTEIPAEIPLDVKEERTA